MANIMVRRFFLTRGCRKFNFVQLSNYTKCPVALHTHFNVDFKRNTGQTLHNHQNINMRIQFYSDNKKPTPKTEKKLTLFEKFKKMYKEYWYVLLPVHLTTSAAWFGGFYYLAKSGVDIPAFLESMHVSSTIVNPLRDSSMGYVAIAYALYKIATPLRYTVTIGGTTISINYLKKLGYIKPVPSTQRLKELYLEKKDNIMETVRETKEEIKKQSSILKDKKEDIIEDLDQGLKKFKELSQKQKVGNKVIQEPKCKNK